MLVLSRKTDEQILVGDNIRITVLRIEGKTVKLGIQAGAEVKVLRAELIDRADSDAPRSCSPDDIADPTPGLGDEVAEAGRSRWGQRQEPSAPDWASPRPAWLTICCCS